MKKRTVVWVIAGCVAAVVAASLASQAYVSLSETEAPPAPSATAPLPAEALRDDVAFLTDLLSRVHPDPISAFPLRPIRPDLRAAGDTLMTPMSPLAFYRRLAPIVASLGDDHVRLHPPAADGPRSTSEHSFPLEVRFIGPRLYVARAHGNTSIPRGAEITAINGVAASTLRDTLLHYAAGTGEAQRVYRLQERFGLLLSAVFGWSPPFEVAWRTAEGAAPTRETVRGGAPSSPEPTPFDWRPLGSHTLLFTFNQFKDPDGTFEGFLERLFEAARRDSVQHLIIDLRRNAGGASALGDQVLRYLADAPFRQLTRSEIKVSTAIRDEFISYVPGYLRWLPLQHLHPTLRPLWTNELGETGTIPFDAIPPHPAAQRFDGRVTLLIGPGTMSSASLFAATVRALGIGILMGRPAGGYATHYGNVVTTHLPASGLRVEMPTSVNYGHSTGPIVPDHRVAPRAADLAAGVDRVLQYALELDAEPRPHSSR